MPLGGASAVAGSAPQAAAAQAVGAAPASRSRITAIRDTLNTGQQSKDSIIAASKTRLQPVLATAITDIAGFIPMAIATGVGSEIQRPLATVVIGGMVTSTLLTLFVLPVIASVFMKKSAQVADSERDQ